MFVETKYNIEQFEKKYQLPVVLHDIGSFEHQPKISRANGYHCYHILWVTKGMGYFEVEGEVFKLSAGMGIFLRPGTPHRYYKGEGEFSTSWVTFSGADGLLNYYGIGKYFCFETPSFLNSSFETLHAVSCSDNNVITRSGKCYVFLTEFLEACFAPTLPLNRQVDQYLENSFSKDVSLNDIADALGINRFSLCRRYSDMQGITIMEQLKRIRLAKAKRYLTSTGFRINEISKMCGFESPSYFGKIFKEETGLTPKEYRGRRSI